MVLNQCCLVKVICHVESRYIGKDSAKEFLCTLIIFMMRFLD